MKVEQEISSPEGGKMKEEHEISPHEGGKMKDELNSTVKKKYCEILKIEIGKLIIVINSIIFF